MSSLRISGKIYKNNPNSFFKMAERRPSLILHINDHISKTVYPFYMIFGIQICNSMAHNIKFSVFTKSKMAAISACVIVIKNCHFESTGCISDDCNIEFVEILKINAYNKKKMKTTMKTKWPPFSLKKYEKITLFTNFQTFNQGQSRSLVEFLFWAVPTIILVPTL